MTKQFVARGNDTNVDNSPNPNHYKLSDGKEVIDVMKDMYGDTAVFDFALLSAYKYISRCMRKHTTPLKDLRKAQYYINRCVDYLEELEHETTISEC